jgi:thioredoxin 1
VVFCKKKGEIMLVELNEENFDTHTKSGLKLVEFYTTWCTYCRNQRIELNDFENSEMWIGLVDAEDAPNIVKRYNIKGFPTFILLKDGNLVTEFAGFHKKDQLLNRLMNFLK